MLKLRNSPPATDAAPRQPTSAEIVAALRADLATAEAAVRAADDSYREKTLLWEINPNDGDAYAAREAALKAAKQARDRVQPHRLQLQDAELRASPAYADRWRRVEAAGDKRLGSVRAIEKAGAALYAAYVEWREANEAMFAEGVIADPEGALCSKLDVDVAFKLELARCGLRWAANGYLDPASIPPLSDRVKAANAHALAQRQP